MNRRAAAVFVLLLLVSMLTCRMFFNADAKTIEYTRYYTSIKIREEDTLSGIAEEYNSCEMSDSEYIDLIKKINHMENENLHIGCYITIMYYDDTLHNQN